MSAIWLATEHFYSRIDKFSESVLLSIFFAKLTHLITLLVFRYSSDNLDKFRAIMVVLKHTLAHFFGANSEERGIFSCNYAKIKFFIQRMSYMFFAYFLNVLHCFSHENGQSGKKLDDSKQPKTPTLPLAPFMVRTKSFRADSKKQKYSKLLQITNLTKKSNFSS